MGLIVFQNDLLTLLLLLFENKLTKTSNLYPLPICYFTLASGTNTASLG